MALNLGKCTLKIMYGRFVGKGLTLLAINSDYVVKSHCTDIPRVGDIFSRPIIRVCRIFYRYDVRIISITTL
jgi:hypothetical protein